MPDPGRATTLSTDLSASGPSRAAAIVLWLTPFTALVVVSGLAFPAVVPRVVFFRTLVAGAVVIALVEVLRGGFRPRSGADPIGPFLLAFVAVSGLTALTGYAPLHSLFGDLQRMGGVIHWLFVLGFYFTLRLFLGDAQWRVFFRVALLAVSAAMVLALVQVLLLGWPSVMVTSLVGNAGYLAILSYLGIAIAALQIASESHALWRGAAVGALTCSGAVLLMLAQRAPILSLIVASLCGGILWRALEPRSRVTLKSLLPVAAAVAVLALVWLARDSAVLRHVPVVERVAALEARGLADLRVPLWKAGLRAVQDRPLLGWGPENFELALSRHFPLSSYRYGPAEVIADRAHNSYLEAAVASGVPGLLAFLAVWAAVLKSVASAYRASRLSRPEAVILASTVAGYVLYLTFWFEDLSSLVLVVGLAAFVGHRAGGPLVEHARAERPSGGRVLLGLLCVAAVIGLWYLHAVRVARAAVAVAPALDPPPDADQFTRLAAFRRTVDIGAPEATDVLTAYTDYLASYAREMDEVRAQPDLARSLDAAVQHAVAAVDREIGRDPLNEYWWLLRSRLLRTGAILYRDIRYHQLAVDAVERAISMSPRRLLYHHELATLHSQGGDNKRALATLAEARKIFDGHGRTQHLQGRLLLEEGRVPEAEAQLREAWKRNFWQTQALVEALAARRLRSEGPGAAARLVWDYLRGKYSTAGSAVPAPLAEASRDAALGAALPLLFLRAGDAAHAAQTAEWLAMALPQSEPAVRRFLNDLRRGRTDAWLARRSLLKEGA